MRIPFYTLYHFTMTDAKILAQLKGVHAPFGVIILFLNLLDIIRTTTVVSHIYVKMNLSRRGRGNSLIPSDQEATDQHEISDV